MTTWPHDIRCPNCATSIVDMGASTLFGIAFKDWLKVLQKMREYGAHSPAWLLSRLDYMERWFKGGHSPSTPRDVVSGGFTFHSVDAMVEFGKQFEIHLYKTLRKRHEEAKAYWFPWSEDW